MCGIVGIVTRQPRSEAQAALQRATRALSHRGPDDEGIELLTPASSEVTVAFGHRRLAILDLSPAGHQPMRDEATGNWITYNGEVFNFRELRRGLEDEAAFRSQSDTEVLLKGYARQGLKAVDEWRGMFALGLWEAARRRLVLLRDRLGIKPLYYYRDGDTFLFASEIRALLATGLVPRRLSRAAVESYLAYGSVQQPLTIIENVYAVLPGQALTLEDNRLASAPYWTLRADAGATQMSDERALVAEIGALLEEAVRLRLVSDVPVGVFLSGGVDSSAVVALMRRATAGRISTFSVYFHEREFNERAHAEQVARRFETDHHPVLVTEKDLAAQVPAALRALDQPSVDGINSYVVSEAAARAGLKVAVSGLGGDEVFAGYSFFRRMIWSERQRAHMRRVPTGARRAAAAAIGIISSGSRAAKLQGLLRGDDLREHSVLLHRQLFTAEQRQSLLEPNGFLPSQRERDLAELRAWDAHQSAHCEAADAINQASVLELGGYLSNTLLRDTDAMSMAHSLEVRVPLIDHRVVERLLMVPGRVKVRARQPKWLLVEAVGDLPREILARPKRGFEFPFKHWLLGSLREQVEDALHQPRLDGLLRAEATQRLWRDFEAGRATWSRVWSLYALGSWARVNL
jgi:asparagine synthase (glutamine-hydrolysing)